MIERRKFLVALGASALAASLEAFAQQRSKIPRLGVLSPYPEDFGVAPSFDAFKQTLRDLGYIEGRNINIDYRWAAARVERLPEALDQLIRLKVDVIYSAWGTPAALAAKKATSTIPIVFAGTGDAVGAGIVSSLSRPGSNLTGATFITEETIAKQLELLKEVVLKISRVGVFINPKNPVYGPVLKASASPARELGLQLEVLEVQHPDEFKNAFQMAIRQRVGGIVVLRDTVLVANQAQLITLAASNHLPAVYGMSDFANKGGLMSYGPNLSDMHRRAAHLVDKILKGAKPSGIPVEQATNFELVINMKTAKALGVKIPQSILARADTVLE